MATRKNAPQSPATLAAVQQGLEARMLLEILPCVPATVTESGDLVISAADALRLQRIASAAAGFLRQTDRDGTFDGFEAFQAIIREECRLG